MRNIFLEPAEPFTLFSYSDFTILIIINILIFFLIHKKVIKFDKTAKIISLLFFLIIIPLISTKIELNNVHNKFEIVDGFNVLYVLLKIPFWWIVGAIDFYIVNRLTKNSIKHKIVS